MFNSSFAEGDSAVASVSLIPIAVHDKRPQVLPRRRIVVEDDFDLFHNLLYYIYINHISFGTDHTFRSSSNNSNMPIFFSI